MIEMKYKCYINGTKSGTGIHATYTPTYYFYMKSHLGYLKGFTNSNS